MKAPEFATRVQRSVSGREVRALDMPFPIWHWTLIYNFLRDKNDTHGGNALGTGHDELRTLMGFFLRQQGSLSPFIYSDPTDSAVIGQVLGSGDGISTIYPVVRTFGGFNEPVTPDQTTVISVYVSGVLSPNGSGWTLGNDNTITFTSPPGAGTVITADFGYYFVVRFEADTYEFENFMYQLWALRQVKFQSVLLP
jgi:uncharacterized protein (TIGR02217 family)